jgi:Ca-activated chloride channel family protein
MLLALPLPLLVRYLTPPVIGTQDAGLKVPSFKSFAVLTDRSEVEQLLNWRFWLSIIAWMLLVLAAARPERIGDELDVPVSGRNLMLAVDLSGSMDAKDFEIGSRRVDRLTATKAVASDFIGRREGDETVKTLLLEAFIGLAGEKTAIGDAITLAVKRIHDQGADADEQVLILLTDGANTAGEIDPLKAADLAQQIGLRVYTIGIGAEQMVVSSITGGMRRVNPSADLDEATLTQIADMTGGQYFRAKDTAGLQEIYRLLDEMEPVAEPEAGFRPVKSLYYWPLAGAFVLAVFLAAMNLLAGFNLSRERKVRLNAG